MAKCKKCGKDAGLKFSTICSVCAAAQMVRLRAEWRKLCVDVEAANEPYKLFEPDLLRYDEINHMIYCKTCGKEPRLFGMYVCAGCFDQIVADVLEESD